MEVTIDQLKERIDTLHSSIQVEPINKGFSMEHKYLVITESGDRLLLRVMPIDQFDRKQIEFGIIQEMHYSGVKAPKPITIGKLDDLNVCYYLLSFIHGADAIDGLPHCPPDVQYIVGLEAGKDLRRMHQYKAPNDVAPWYQRQMHKYTAYVEMYKKLDVKVKNEERILDFITRHERYLRNRPSRFQHDDFHVGNIIVDDGKYAGVIDFNRFDWGDPIHDFLKVGFFSREVSIPFCRGQLDGYFENAVIPTDFWKLYAVYIAMAVISSVVWTLRVVPHTINDMMERINQVLEDHKYFELTIPSWFSEYAL